MTIVGAGGAATAIEIQAALDGVAELTIFNLSLIHIPAFGAAAGAALGAAFGAAAGADTLPVSSTVTSYAVQFTVIEMCIRDSDNTVCFITDIQNNLIFFNIDDSTLYNLSISDSLYGIFQHLFKT